MQCRHPVRRPGARYVPPPIHAPLTLDQPIRDHRTRLFPIFKPVRINASGTRWRTRREFYGSTRDQAPKKKQNGSHGGHGGHGVAEEAHFKTGIKRFING